MATSQAQGSVFAKSIQDIEHQNQDVVVDLNASLSLWNFFPAIGRLLINLMSRRETKGNRLDSTKLKILPKPLILRQLLYTLVSRDLKRKQDDVDISKERKRFEMTLAKLQDDLTTEREQHDSVVKLYLATIDIQKKEILNLNHMSNGHSSLTKDAITLHKRFLVHAKEGMIDRTDRSLPPYQRSDNDMATVKAGNAVAHRANIISHRQMYIAGILSPEEKKTFKQMYQLDPDTNEDHLMTTSLIKMWDMMGTMAAFPPHIKFGTYTEYTKAYDAFQALATRTWERRKSTVAYGRNHFDADKDVVANLARMQGILEKFRVKDMRERMRDY